ncbi:MAG TPA: FKBP-type peptidyl-prolyl cis-trans isomerase [Pseudonocardiaceae bacterium]|jgi:FKBP-type peptidyl-prolyl cis-trans isomerase|nr:FKBP-type peptidyl-prolyl cis-trans isomerase [Pseudonocardiaceae bacterium]
MRTVGRTALVLVSLLSGVSLASCAASDQTSSGGQTTGSTQSGSTASGTPCKAADFKVTGAFGEKPTITIPDCRPTNELITSDLTPGTGAEVKPGSTATVNYQLVTFSDKVEKDSSFDRGQPFELKNVGQARVIDGWNEGLIGLKEGGRRLLVVPPDKGYGQGGNGIKPNETLVFVIDAVKVTG